jgi:3-phenylpropionate/trans-cinnamate dioxygenase ferredoxin reductase component
VPPAARRCGDKGALLNDQPAIVIVGGGHAAAALCAALAAEPPGVPLHLVCEEPVLPYQRPPLSKAYLKSPQETLQHFRSDSWYADAGISVHRADPAVAIDRGRQTVQLRSGREIVYQHLVLATGARARGLPGLPARLDNVVALRSAADADRLRALLAAKQSVTVLGGGFIGLEVAAAAAQLGKAVMVLESAPRLLARSVSAPLADHVLQTHRASGIDLRLGVHCDNFEVDGSRLAALHADGQREPVDALVLGIGATPEITLALAAGLACDGAVLVDAQLRSSDPSILAIGDCAAFIDAASGVRLRLESVPNASDQARTAAATLAGRNEPYRALPWFWSEQGALRLQMAGLLPRCTTAHRRPGATAGSFSFWHYVGERLACVESVNAPMDHLSARKLLEAGRHPAAARVSDAAVALKTLL